uniref:Uncharacterized protein n=1 Tax=viral metagenome TaxID=1070528 RepID=A0A6C0DFV2_9ZZZZ
MRKQSYILSTGLTILFLILTVYLVNRIFLNNLSSSKQSNVENFTPGIRKFVRPHLRNAELATDEYREYFTDKTNKGLKMLGLQFV